MDITTVADTYAPGIDDTGNFVDCIPSFAALPQGIRCICGARKNKIYNTPSIFSAHLKTAHHKAWLSQLNFNKANLFVENENNKALVKEQRRIIADMESEIRRKSANIEILLSQLTATRTYTETADLIDIH